MPPANAVPHDPASPIRHRRLLAASGAVLAACAVALAAYAAHGVDGAVQSRLQTAAAFAFGHGLALAALAPQAGSRLACGALVVLLAGTVLFCGGITAAALAATGGGAAPFGGTLLIAGWLAFAIAMLRRR